MDEAGNDFPTDVLVEILQRLPPSSRRRVRLVCRHWRGAVDDRTPEMQNRAFMALVSVKNANMWTRTSTASGYVVDDLPGGRCREAWTGNGDVHVIGTCNGIISVCDDGKPGGAVTLVNPATGETLAVPPLPRHYHYSSAKGQPAPSVRWHEAYSFGYHPVTGRYKIVYVPCYLDSASNPVGGWLDMAHVFTLGEAVCGNVPLPAATRASGSGGLVSFDGATYWLGKGARKMVSLDLGDEHLAAWPLPMTAKPGDGFRLMVVRGKLGVAVDSITAGKTDVWVLEGRRWTHRYDVQLHRWERLTSPHFAHGKYFLATKGLWVGSVLYGHMLDDSDERRSIRLCDLVPTRELVPVVDLDGYIDRTFAYVETTEPLCVYKQVQHKPNSNIQDKLSTTDQKLAPELCRENNNSKQTRKSKD